MIFSLMKLVAKNNKNGDVNTGITSEYQDSTQDIYTFMDDKDKIVTTRLAPNTPISVMAMDKKKHDINTFLNRPVLLGTYTFSSTQTEGERVASHILHKSLNNWTLFPKILGYRYFRATTVLTVYMNAQPFQQGALLMYYIPITPLSTQYSQVSTLTGKSGFLSEVLVAEDKVPVQLRIPFNHPQGYLDIVKIEGDMGTFFIDVYSPLKSSVATTCQLTVFSHFEDVELLGPTSEVLDAALRPAGLTYEAQIGTESEQQGKTGIVTKVTDVINKVSKTLAMVPELSAVMKPVSWVTAALHAVASAFGWSKPTNVNLPGRVKLQTAPYMTNFNGSDTSHNMGMDADNQILPYQFFGDSDPMAFDNIVTRLNYIKQVSWTVALKTGAVLLNLAVVPTLGKIVAQKAAGENSYFQVAGMTHLGFVASFFRFWHGDIRFQFRVVKTKFHSGRLLIKWTPGVVRGVNMQVHSLAYSVVWDVAENNSVSFVVPYLNPKPWLLVPATSDAVSLGSVNCHNGVVEVLVINELVAANEAVPDSVSIIVELAGEKGFSFGQPIDPRFFPITTDAPGEEDGYSMCECQYDAQIGDPVNTVNLVTEGIKPVGLEPEKLSMGEKIISFRQIIKRFGYHPLIFSGAGKNAHEYTTTGLMGDTVSIAGLHLDPFQFAFSAPLVTSLKKHPASPDTLTTVGSIFAYWRGSVRFKYLCIDSLPIVKDNHWIFASYAYDGRTKSVTNAPAAGLKSLLDQQGSNLMVYKPIEGALELTVPYYARTAYHPTVGTIGYDDDAYVKIAIISDKSSLKTDEVKHAVWRAAGDDFDFLFPVGVPLFQYKPFGLED